MHPTVLKFVMHATNDQFLVKFYFSLFFAFYITISGAITSKFNNGSGLLSSVLLFNILCDEKSL